MNSYVFLTECNDFAQAQVIKSYLVSLGYHPKVRDEQTRTVAPHLEQFLGRLLIEIPESEFLGASQALEELEARTRLQITEPEENPHSATQDLAKKAVINAVLGCLFLPLICNFYSMLLGWRVLRQERPLTSLSGKRLMLAIFFNAVAFYIWLVFGFKYFFMKLHS